MTLVLKYIVTWSCVVIWFFHLLVGAGALAAAYRLYPERANNFVRKTMLHLNAAMLDALGGIALIFVAKNVVFTWKFTIVFFAVSLARDVARIPLILYVLRGPKGSEG